MHEFIIAALVAILIKENLQVSALRRAVSQRSIIFPEENWDDCFLDDAATQPGLCKTLQQCPDILKKWDLAHVYPKTCYFIKSEQYVCCPVATTKEAHTTPKTANDTIHSIFRTDVEGGIRRRSELECDLQNQQTSGVIDVEGPGKFPFMAALGWRSNNGNTKLLYACTGVLISDRFVLTSAHCAQMDGQTPAFVRVGGHTIADTETGAIQIKRFIKHRQHINDAISTDIALVELERNVNNPVACLWSSRNTPTTNVTALTYVHAQIDGLTFSQMHKIPLNIINGTECQRLCTLDDTLKSMDDGDRICAGEGGPVGGMGDPLVMEIGNVTYVVGVNSFGLACTGSPPSIYSRVSSFVDWIEAIIWPDIDVRFHEK